MNDHEENAMNRRIQELRIAGRQNRKDAEEWNNNHKKQQLERWRQAAGSRVDRFLASEDATFEAASKNDHPCQVSAMQMLTYHWEASGTTRCLQLYKTLIEESNDSSLRIQAILCSSIGLFQTNDPEWLKRYCRIVYSVSEGENVRRAAYIAIYTITGNPVPCDMKVIKLLPSDFDWEFVGQCARMG